MSATQPQHRLAQPHGSKANTTGKYRSLESEQQFVRLAASAHGFDFAVEGI